MYKGAEAEEGREGNASREEREEQRREGEEERGKSRRVQGVCLSFRNVNLSSLSENSYTLRVTSCPNIPVRSVLAATGALQTPPTPPLSLLHSREADGRREKESLWQGTQRLRGGTAATERILSSPEGQQRLLLSTQACKKPCDDYSSVHQPPAAGTSNLETSTLNQTNY
ncbi:hypothetical protein Q8A67_018281 [Cirrhinus molitorella]|uniref:Uncharacterized protein n=1 Tax=Cirrhinus molitorella TaxID=172907 RepID=A0AA88PN53_9TELE|nr:hypothetical protein Q8A67_018281 [Cirrhinus molitorella]